jgi:uncharacterized membrane protein YdjX (TVP38/TMEM64 family)
MPRTLIRLATLLILLILMALLWRYLNSTGVLTPERLESWIVRLDTVKSSPWAAPGIAAVYIIALLLAFPLTLLVVLTALLFGSWWGLLYATLGTLSSSAVTFWVGHFVGRQAMERHGGRHLRALSGFMGKRGIRSMMVINLLPLAPFTFTNLMAGAFSMPFLRYMLGSAIGIIPGLAFVTILGGQANNIMQADNSRDVLWAIGLSAVTASLFAAVMVMVRRRRQAAQTP